MPVAASACCDLNGCGGGAGTTGGGRHARAPNDVDVGVPPTPPAAPVGVAGDPADGSEISSLWQRRDDRE